MSTLHRDEIVTINQKGWNKVAPMFYGGTALPKYGPLADMEDSLNLIPDLQGKHVLELGCGSGHTLSYLRENRNAGELWGLDFSEEQIRFSRDWLAEKQMPAKLFQASIDENPGIPENHFDLVLAIYALGWTPDLARTLSLVYSYLKPGGIFIFSWEHPAYGCLDYNADTGKYVFERSYQKEGPEFLPSWKDTEIVIHHRKLSTYLNALVCAGLAVERVIESEPNLALAREQDLAPGKWYSVPRAQLMPTTFIVKAYKPNSPSFLK
jgi:SAM-dependent methyltransferase